jgi:hypothetical protein
MAKGTHTKGSRIVPADPVKKGGLGESPSPVKACDVVVAEPLTIGTSVLEISLESRLGHFPDFTCLWPAARSGLGGFQVKKSSLDIHPTRRREAA